MSRRSLRRQGGIAIITAVAVAALVAALAAALAFRHNIWLRQVENQQDIAQARGVARSAIDLSRLTLQGDRRQNTYDHAREPWAIPIPDLPVERGHAGGRLRDAQGGFNLNNLINDGGVVSSGDLAAFQRLLTELNLSPDLANALLDWQDADSETRYPGGAEDREYLARTPARRAANRRLFDLDELRQVQGFDDEVMKKLEPFVTVLPVQTAVNVNFASTEVLLAVLPGLDRGTAQGLAQRVKTKPFESFEEMKGQLPDAAIGQAEGDRPLMNRISVETNYFYSDVDARFGRVSIAYRALLERSSDQIPRVVWMRRR